MNTEDLITKLEDFSSRFKRVKGRVRINLVIELNEFLKLHKQEIKEKCPDKLIEILNSL